MFGLAVGISRVGAALPAPVYALLSGLNAATVGVMILASTQLAEKAVSDALTRALLFLSAAAGLLYSALWYFPVLIVTAGLVAGVYDSGWFQRLVEAVGAMFTRFKGSRARGDVEAQHDGKTEQAAEGNGRVIADCDEEDGPATITMHSHIAVAMPTQRGAMSMAMS